MFATPKDKAQFPVPATRPTSVYSSASGFSALPSGRSPAANARANAGAAAPRRRPVTPKRKPRAIATTPERGQPERDQPAYASAIGQPRASRGRPAAPRTPPARSTPRTPHSQSAASLHLSGEEKRSRERHAILHSLQQTMQAKRHVFGHDIQDPAHVFAAFDTDGSGSVSPDELFQALKRLGLGLSEEQIGRLAAFLDVDGDGEIDYAELLGFLHGEGGNVAAAAAYDAANLQQQSSRAYSPRSPHPPAPTVQQSPWRVQLAMRAVEEADAEEHRVAASKLQARWRGISTRRAIEDGNWEALPVDWLQAELVHPGTPSDLITIGANGGWEAAETVQRNYRGHVDRKKVRHIRETAAATRVQKVHRGRSERQRRHEEAQKANHIQKHYRGAQGRRSAAAKLERESGASQTIQRVQRGKRGRARFETVQRERIEEEARAARQQQLEEASTVTIQANYRGAHTRARISELAHPPRYQEYQEKRAAVKLQAIRRSTSVQRRLQSPECTELQRFLQGSGLTRFFGSFVEHGVESIAQMDTLSADDLLGIGLRKRDVKKLRMKRLLKRPNTAALKKLKGAEQAEADEVSRRRAQAAAVGVGKAAAQVARAKVQQSEAAQEQNATMTERDQLLFEASVLLQDGSWAGSIEHYTRFIAHPHVDEVARLSLAEVYHKRGHCLEMSGNMEAAEDDYTAGIALAGSTDHSDGFALYYHRGRLRVGLGDIKGGKEDLGTALALQEQESASGMLRGSGGGPLGPGSVFPDRTVLTTSVVTIVCPEGVHGGGMIVVELGDGEIEIRVPDGLGGGDEWDVELDETLNDVWTPATLTLAAPAMLTLDHWKYEIKEERGVIGRAEKRGSTPRGPTADCLLDGDDMTIARRHAEIVVTESLAEDEGDADRGGDPHRYEISCFDHHFVRINGEILRGSASKKMVKDDVITIGSTKIRFTPGCWQVHQPTATSIPELLKLCNQMVTEEHEDKAAVKIQARIRGKQTRQDIALALEAQALAEAEHEALQARVAQEQAEVKAAIGIQARVRGRQVRMELREMELYPLPREEERSAETEAQSAHFDEDAGEWLTRNGASDIAAKVVNDFGAKKLRDLMYIVRERDDWDFFLPGEKNWHNTQRWDGLWSALSEEHAQMEEVIAQTVRDDDEGEEREAADDGRGALSLEATSVMLEPEPEPELSGEMETKSVTYYNQGPLGLTLGTMDPFDVVWLASDKNGNGILSRGEVAEVLDGLGRPSSKQDVDEVYSEMDADQDGPVDIGEFENWYKLQPGITEEDLLKAPVRIERCEGYSKDRGLVVGLHVLTVQGVDVRDSTLREVSAKIKAAKRPLTIEFTPVGSDVMQYSSSRGQLHRERKEQKGPTTLSVNKARGPGFAADINKQLGQPDEVISSKGEADDTVAQVTEPPRARSPPQKRRFPSKPRTPRKPKEQKVKLSAMSAFMAADSANPGSGDPGEVSKQKAPTGEIVTKAAAVADHYRASKVHADLVAEAEKRADSNYYHEEAQVKLEEKEREHLEMVAEFEVELSHAQKTLANAEEGYARCEKRFRELKLSSAEEDVAAHAKATAELAAAMEHLQEEQEHLEAMEEMVDELHATSDHIHEEVAAEIEEAKEDHDLAIASAKELAEEAKAVISADADENQRGGAKKKTGEEKEKLPEDDHYVTVAVPAGLEPHEALQIELKDGRKVEVDVPEGMSAGDEFEVYIGPPDSPTPEEEQPAVARTPGKAPLMACAGPQRRAPRTPADKPKPRLACGSPQRNRADTPPRPTLAFAAPPKEPTPDIHDEIAAYLAQREFDQETPRDDFEDPEKVSQILAVVGLHPRQQQEQPEMSLSLSPMVAAPAPRKQQIPPNLSMALSAGLAGLSGPSPTTSARPPSAGGGFNRSNSTAPPPWQTPANARTFSTQSQQWPAPTTSAASGWGVTPIPHDRGGGNAAASLGVAFAASKPASSSMSTSRGGTAPKLHPSDLSAIHAAFRPSGGGQRTPMGGVEIRQGAGSGTWPAGGVRRFKSPMQRQTTSSNQQTPPTEREKLKQEKMQRRHDAEKRAREQHHAHESRRY